MVGGRGREREGEGEGEGGRLTNCYPSCQPRGAAPEQISIVRAPSAPSATGVELACRAQPPPHAGAESLRVLKVEPILAGAVPRIALAPNAATGLLGEASDRSVGAAADLVQLSRDRAVRRLGALT